MTEHPAAPTTEAGRAFVREFGVGGIYSGQGDVAFARRSVSKIEAEARAAARKEVTPEMLAIAIIRIWHGSSEEPNAADIEEARLILDSLSTDTREEPSKP